MQPEANAPQPNVQPVAPAPAPVITPAPQPTPQPAEPAQQPPAQIYNAPVSEPAPVIQPSQPSIASGIEPAAQPAAQAPQPAAQPGTQPQFKSYDEFLATYGGGQPQTVDAPSLKDINPDDEKQLQGFFEGLVNTAEQRAAQRMERASVIQRAERESWDSAFAEFPALKDPANKPLRDIIHNARVNSIQNGQYVSHSDIARTLFAPQAQSYTQGVTDANVTRQIVASQPAPGVTSAPTTPAVNPQSLTGIQQTGAAGQEALESVVANLIAEGKM